MSINHDRLIGLMPLKLVAITLLAGLITAGCDDDDGDDTGAAADTGNGSTLTAQATIPAGDSRCPNGGITIDSGIDENGNGELDEDEVDNTQVVCNGQDGADGQDGQAGQDGQDGQDGAPGADGEDGRDGGGAAQIGFEPVPVPTTDEQKRSVLASQSFTDSLTGQSHDIDFHVLLRSGTEVDGNMYGRLYDIEGNPLSDADGSPVFSNDNDFNSLLTGKTDGELYLVSHFENYDVGMMYVTALNQDPDTGELTPEKTRPIDFSHFNGGWIHCAGSVTPWGTHLGSEEYEPDWTYVDPETNMYTGWQSNNGTSANMASYFEGSEYYTAEDPAAAGMFEDINWYDYGWEVEVTVNSYNDVEAVKHYAMGRTAHELAYVLPDSKTAYISDDGSYVGLWRFVADEAEDLSAGTLYAAKWHQTDTENGGSADLTWVDLGHATNEEIRDFIDRGVKLSDIFETEPLDEEGESCPPDFVETEHTWSVDHGWDGECLLLRVGNNRSEKFNSDDEVHTAASRLETRRYAAYNGATTEWEKMEGIAYDPMTNTLYQAMSRVRKGMSDDKGDIQLPYNYCGTVYAMPLDDDYVAHEAHGAVSGVPRMVSRGATQDFPYDPPLEANQCDLNHISEPDNITFMPEHRILIIGEDTGSGHQNDVIWAYNVNSGDLTRIQTTPYGSETTSPYYYPNINGWAYLMSVIQHPFGESDQGKLQDEEESRAYTGYIGPFPAVVADE